MSVSSLRSVCRRAEALRRVARGGRAGLVAAGAASLAGALVAVGARSLGFDWPSWLAAALPGAGAAAGLVWSLVYQSRPLQDAALALEERYGLKTLLTTALAFGSSGASSTFVDSILRDAEARARQIDPRSIVQWRLGRPLGFALASAALLAAATVFFPPLDLLNRGEREAREEAQRVVRREEARRLEDLARQLDVRTSALPATDAAGGDIAAELDRLADALRDPMLSRDDAMLKVSDLKEKLNAEREVLEAKTPELSAMALKDLKTAEGRALALSLMNREFGQAAGQASALAEALRAERFAGAEQAALGEDLGKIADALKGNDSVAGGLAAAGDSLESGRGQAGAERLDKLADTLKELAGAAEAERALAAAAEALDRTRRSVGEGASPSAEGGEPAAGEPGQQGEGRGSESSAPGAEGSRASAGPEGSAGEPGAQGLPASSGDGASGSADGAGESTSSSAASGSPDASGSGSSGASGAQPEGTAGSASTGETPGAQGAPGQPSGAAGSPSQSGSQGGAQGATPGSSSQGGAPGAGQQGDSGAPGAGEQSGGGWGETAPTGADDSGAGGQNGQGGGQQGQSGQSGQAGQSGSGGQSASGASGGGQSGSAGSGASASSGQGSSGGAAASGASPGSAAGGGGSDWGVGSTNLEQGGGASSPREPSASSRQAAGASREWEEKFMSLYRERSIQARTFDGKVQGQRGEGPELGWRSTEAPVERRRATAAEGDLFMETRSREKQSLDQQDIPFEYKDSVRRYFDSIEAPTP